MGIGTGSDSLCESFGCCVADIAVRHAEGSFGFVGKVAVVDVQVIERVVAHPE